jgi:ABC-type polysaccharide/polyol phosphate transport system ATPase subunit
MESFVSGSSIVVLASHALPLLEEWCSRALLLDQGRIIAAGTVEDVAEQYQGRTAAGLDAVGHDMASA